MIGWSRAVSGRKTGETDENSGERKIFHYLRNGVNAHPVKMVPLSATQV
jgi:hypothetical protein